MAINKISVHGVEYDVGGTTVSVTPTLTSGTQIGTITVDDVDTNLFCSPGTVVSVTPTLTSGTQIGTITVNGVGTDLFCSGGRNITVSTAEPTSGDGSNGDLWIVYTA